MLKVKEFNKGLYGEYSIEYSNTLSNLSNRLSSLGEYKEAK
jgi:hypothetical protein